MRFVLTISIIGIAFLQGLLWTAYLGLTIVSLIGMLTTALGLGFFWDFLEKYLDSLKREHN